MEGQPVASCLGIAVSELTNDAEPYRHATKREGGYVPSDLVNRSHLPRSDEVDALRGRNAFHDNGGQWKADTRTV